MDDQGIVITAGRCRFRNVETAGVDFLERVILMLDREILGLRKLYDEELITKEDLDKYVDHKLEAKKTVNDLIAKKKDEGCCPCCGSKTDECSPECIWHDDRKAQDAINLVGSLINRN